MAVFLQMLHFQIYFSQVVVVSSTSIQNLTQQLMLLQNHFIRAKPIFRIKIFIYRNSILLKCSPINNAANVGKTANPISL